MSIDPSKAGIDVGIVTTRPAEMLDFYVSVVGLTSDGVLETAFGPMHRLRCGESYVNLIVPHHVPDRSAVPGGVPAATGLRFIALSVTSVQDVMARCEQADCRVAVPVTEVRPGTRLAIVEDPDGNWVEFVQS